MSDFKVGDVVRCNQARCPCDHKDETVTEVHPWGVKVTDGSICQPQYLSLVSRPSEAKPQPPALKVGDRVRVIQRPGKDSFSSWVGTIGTIFEWHEPTKTWGIRHEAGKVNGREWSGWAPDSLELLPPEPAPYALGTMLIIIDELHPRRRQQGKVVEARNGGYVLEMRPGVTVHVLAGMVAEAPKPMTATEASIKARNSYEPLLPTADQMEYLQNKMMRDIINSMALSREMLEGHAHRAPVPDNQGWMPAGTYMPLKERSIEIKQLRPKFRAITGKLDPTEQGAGIAKAIPLYSRRFPSRTTQWANLGDDYELLEDAE